MLVVFLCSDLIIFQLSILKEQDRVKKNREIKKEKQKKRKANKEAGGAAGMYGIRKCLNIACYCSLADILFDITDMSVSLTRKMFYH